MTMFDNIDDTKLSRVQGGRASCDLSGLPASARSIIQSESGGDPTAKNPTSTAFGLGQLTIANRHALMANPGSTNCSEQIAGFTKYVNGRYGSFDRALAFRKRHNWY
jgi:Transglycosylase SLT domain